MIQALIKHRRCRQRLAIRLDNLRGDQNTLSPGRMWFGSQSGKSCITVCQVVVGHRLILFRVRFHTSSYGTRQARKRWHTQRSTESLYTVPALFGDGIYDRRILQATVHQWSIQYLTNDKFRAVLHSYLCWDYPSNQLFDKEPFLDGLAGGPSNDFTALLMHSIIAFASVSIRSITSQTSANIQSRRIIASRTRKTQVPSSKMPSPKLGDCGDPTRDEILAAMRQRESCFTWSRPPTAMRNLFVTFWREH